MGEEPVEFVWEEVAPPCLPWWPDRGLSEVRGVESLEGALRGSEEGGGGAWNCGGDCLRG